MGNRVSIHDADGRGCDVLFTPTLEALARALFDSSDTEAVTVVVPLTDGQLFATLRLISREEYFADKIEGVP